MASFPLGLGDLSLLLAMTVVELLIVFEMLSTNYGSNMTRIRIKRLRNAAFVFFFLFMVTLTIRIVIIVLSP